MLTDYLAAFQAWCKLKIALWRKENAVVFKQQEIWWCCLGMNLGEETFGKGERFTRPVLIFKKFTGNSFLGLPLTMQEKHGSWYAEIETHGVRRWAMLNQARIFDKRRLTSRIGTVGTTDFKKVKEKFLEFYGS